MKKQLLFVAFTIIGIGTEMQAQTGVTVAGNFGQNTDANQLYNPTGVAVDASGNVYVCDQSNDRI